MMLRAWMDDLQKFFVSKLRLTQEGEQQCQKAVWTRWVGMCFKLHHLSEPATPSGGYGARTGPRFNGVNLLRTYLFLAYNISNMQAHEEWGQEIFESADLIIVSPMTRALQTAYLIGGGESCDTQSRISMAIEVLQSEEFKCT